MLIFVMAAYQSRSCYNPESAFLSIKASMWLSRWRGALACARPPDVGGKQAHGPCRIAISNGVRLPNNGITSKAMTSTFLIKEDAKII